MMRRTQQVPRWQTFVRCVSFICLLAGSALLVYCAYILLDANLYQAAQSRRFGSLSSTVSRADSPKFPIAVLEPGSPIGRIEIPRLGLSVVVLEGDANRTLQRGPGRVTGSAWPGQSGNFAIAAHRDTFFRPLRFVRKDDFIRMTTAESTIDYRVDSVQIVSPTHTEVLENTAEPTLTLVTCYPFVYVGSAPKRFVVRARQISSTKRTTSANCLAQNTLGQDSPANFAAGSH